MRYVIDRLSVALVAGLSLGILVHALLVLGAGWEPIALVTGFVLMLALVGMILSRDYSRPPGIFQGEPRARGTVVDVKEEQDRLVLEVLSDSGENRPRLRFEVPKDWDVNFGDRVRLQGRYAVWTPAAGAREFPLPLLAFSHTQPEADEPLP